MGSRRDGQAAGTKNKSELLFEGYLRAHGYSDFEFEPELSGTSRRPDYALPHAESQVLFEVKEFRGTPEEFTSGFGSFDPYPPVREKIEQARDKFAKLKEFCCCLVLYNRDKPLVLLDWEHVYGAMLGNLGLSVPLDLPGRPSSDDSVKSIFMSGGKMHRERGGTPYAPQNQTISAIVVLGRVAVGERRFRQHRREQEEQLGRRLTGEELYQALDRTSGTAMDFSLRQLRVVVHENPYARIPFPSDLFRGPYDERYGPLDGGIQRLFQGEAIAALPGED